jgi:hypothetical protein
VRQEGAVEDHIWRTKVPKVRSARVTGTCSTSQTVSDEETLFAKNSLLDLTSSQYCVDSYLSSPFQMDFVDFKPTTFIMQTTILLCITHKSGRLKVTCALSRTDNKLSIIFNNVVYTPAQVLSKRYALQCLLLVQFFA